MPKRWPQLNWQLKIAAGFLIVVGILIFAAVPVLWDAVPSMPFMPANDPPARSITTPEQGIELSWPHPPQSNALRSETNNVSGSSKAASQESMMQVMRADPPPSALITGEALTKPQQEPLQAAESQPVVSIKPAEVKAQPQWPLDGVIALDMGWHMHPVFQDWRFHPGIDISVSGAAPVKSILPGVVRRVYTDTRSGLTVEVESGALTVSYGSLASVDVVTQAMVKQGQTIGTVGDFVAEPEPHLHLVIRENGSYVDPHEVLPRK